MIWIISGGGQAWENYNSDACYTGIVDIIHMSIDIMHYLRKYYRLPYVQHEGGRPLTMQNPELLCSLSHDQIRYMIFFLGL